MYIFIIYYDLLCIFDYTKYVQMHFNTNQFKFDLQKNIIDIKNAIINFNKNIIEIYLLIKFRQVNMFLKYLQNNL